jgi:hypothetical protein
VPEMEAKGLQEHKNSLCVVATEALFILLPFVVIGIALSNKGQFSKFLYMPEWAISAAVLIGLSLVRFTSGLLQGNIQMTSLSWQRVMLIFSMVIVLALVPSLLVLALVLVSGAPSQGLAFAQIVLFALGLFLFVAFGWTGQQFLEEAKSGSNNRELTVITTARAVGE